MKSPVPKSTTTRIGMKRKSAVDWIRAASADIGGEYIRVQASGLKPP
jgi:hypothetical protein